jgi:epsilon-lactone hydrolase
LDTNLGSGLPRASRQARIARTLSFVTARPLLHVMPVNLPIRRVVRVVSDRFSEALVGIPSGTEVTRVREGRVLGEWVKPAGAATSDQVIFYVHGGGYTGGSTRSHRSLVSRLAAATGLPAFSCDYRLAPEHRFPSAADDIAGCYEWIVAQGVAAQNVIVMGDSAGGHLVVDLVLELARQGLPQPRAMVLMSPLIDLTCTLAAEGAARQRDSMFTVKGARRMFDLYTAGCAEDTPRLKLDFSAAHCLPPTLIQASSAEMLSVDARYLAESLQSVGVQCELDLWPGQLHVFQAFAYIPESQIAIARIAEFVRTLEGSIGTGSGDAVAPVIQTK